MDTVRSLKSKLEIEIHKLIDQFHSREECEGVFIDEIKVHETDITALSDRSPQYKAIGVRVTIKIS